MNIKLIKQLAAILLLVTLFILFHLAVYSNFTYRYRETSSKVMREQSIELDKYLPFDDDSMIVHLNSNFKLAGKLPVLDGATALFPIYSAFVNAVYPEESVSFDGFTFSASSALQKTGTGPAYKAVVDGTADIIFAAEPSREQIDYAAVKNVELSYVPIGYEAFVFIVNTKNPVSSLSSVQLRGIYSGVYKNWREVDGEDSPIVQVQRVAGSGSQTAMLSFMGDIPLMTRPSSIIGRAIGYSFRYYVSDLSGKENIKMLAVDGVYPSEENIRNGTYPITDCFYAVYRTDNENENAARLLDWILSDEGRYIIEETGYVPVNYDASVY